jgi:hypothetical protein
MRNLIVVSVACLALLFLAGSAGDGGCGGGTVKTAQELCLDSGGTWDDGPCPSACWPPQCGQTLKVACIAACGKEPVCACPKSAPYWEDGKGCLSATSCSPQATCNQAGGQCGTLIGTSVKCPAGYPTPWSEAGTCPQGVLGSVCCM